MVVGVRLLAMVHLFVLLAVIVAVRQFAMMVVVGVPVRPVLPLPHEPAPMMMRDVVVVVLVLLRQVGVRGRGPLSFDPLRYDVLLSRHGTVLRASRLLVWFRKKTMLLLGGRWQYPFRRTYPPGLNLSSARRM